MVMLPIHMILAIDERSGIGKNGGLPWSLSADLKRFKQITTRTVDPRKKNVVLMGRRTWESLPAAFRPLPGRMNVVITRQREFPLPPEVHKAADFHEALALIDQRWANLAETIFVIGGVQVFQEAIQHYRCRKLYLTRVLRDFSCDTFFPLHIPQFVKTETSPLQSEGGVEFFFEEYERS